MGEYFKTSQLNTMHNQYQSRLLFLVNFVTMGNALLQVFQMKIFFLVWISKSFATSYGIKSKHPIISLTSIIPNKVAKLTF